MTTASTAVFLFNLLLGEHGKSCNMFSSAQPPSKLELLSWKSFTDTGDAAMPELSMMACVKAKKATS